MPDPRNDGAETKPVTRQRLTVGEVVADLNRLSTELAEAVEIIKHIRLVTTYGLATHNAHRLHAKLDAFLARHDKDGGKG